MNTSPLSSSNSPLASSASSSSTECNIDENQPSTSEGHHGRLAQRSTTKATIHKTNLVPSPESATIKSISKRTLSSEIAGPSGVKRQKKEPSGPVRDSDDSSNSDDRKSASSSISSNNAEIILHRKKAKKAKKAKKKYVRQVSQAQQLVNKAERLMKSCAEEISSDEASNVAFQAKIAAAHYAANDAQMAVNKAKKRMKKANAVSYSYKLLKASLKENKATPEAADESTKPYKCYICNKGFRLLRTMTDHFKIHTGERPYKCQFCDEAFVQSSHLKSHEASQHLAIGNYPCPKCFKSFETRSKLKLHNESSHKEKKSYHCHHCDKRFAQRSQVVEHERVHTGERPYQCSLCDMAFTKSSNLKSHLNSKHGTKK